LELANRIRDLVPALDCMPLEDAGSAPAVGLHDDRFSNSGAAEIPRGRSAELMVGQPCAPDHPLSAVATRFEVRGPNHSPIQNLVS
jgi:hypothetical protein